MKFAERLKEERRYPLRAENVEILQVNLGYRCNMSCKHCHVQAGPARREMMDMKTVETVLNVLRRSNIATLDITGGAPELNPHFQYLVTKSKEIGRHIIIRSNLTIFFEDGMEDMPEFYRENEVEVIASLPYYLKDNVDRVRGRGTFHKSMNAIKKLNVLGYGRRDGLTLNLVYNPQGAFLPPEQCSIERDYRKELKEKYGVDFDKLYTFANMPIGRFSEFLRRSGNFEKYMDTLIDAFNPSTLDGIMCRHLISVGWNGKLYDCDFNQVAGIGLSDGNTENIADFDFERLAVREIAADDHCFGCTAGQGST
ncbi:antilisterial bacteriocin subtilosin biosynthesis protein AlbA [bacterium BMS3Abin07]|nr:antilisterial bacteriocin subtilosin biosynthesis protein AlbA [bacterium BMS3Abin07]GBE33432.1 antilisterial bacteriocin subtilosin biosynthesis protein AlbA [bacterium BMS3Bbin05]HDL21046.1 radical SAM/Cys-rich domain protein [Nitrospirota bacterium]HDO22175.1 radical SAM/Cys-rich domain protein [Nitrospirota bacterium]HDZ87849.1 radical SAM/Cys-rich domain protein [Nitrospirota bacterium]